MPETPNATAPTRSLSEKILELESLAEILQGARKGKKVVHCHGVFDLLHIGHLRYIREASRYGDLLVVTVTPDRFVNKGPHRPAFSENLRAEALAALEDVDYVAVNHWPTAVETIGLLRPDYYVKGPDYKDATLDRSGGILLEEEAVRAAGGEIAFTSDATWSSSQLINRHLPRHSREAAAWLEKFGARYSPDDVIGYLDRARDLKVLVVGEAIIDEYCYCEAIGKSSKEPMLAVKQRSAEVFAGGILAVGNHVANFCDRVGLLTILGRENSHEAFIREKLNSRIDACFIHRNEAPTIVKRRFIESYFFTKMMEVYEMNDAFPEPAENERFCAELDRLAPDYDVVIVVDFGHGTISPEAVETLSRRSRFLAVNAQSNAGNLGFHTISRYPRADYVTLAENEIRLEARDRQGPIEHLIGNVAEKLGARRAVVTRGKHGSVCYARHDGVDHVPALAREVIDRMGAGDAFLSITALCAAQDAPADVIGFIGNLVGAQAVATVGHRGATDRVGLIKSIESLMK